LPKDSDVDLNRLAADTEGWTGAGLELICKKAATLAWEEFEDGARKQALSVTQHQLQTAKSELRAKP
jgi:SpoVK/Ycf46/Vps4 family AAA+-type ATPase